MQSTISELTLRGSLFLSFLLVTIASPLSFAEDKNRLQQSCTYNEKAMMELSPREFDQNFENGWRVIAKNNDCLEVAANLIRIYYTTNEVSTGAKRTFVWHEGQLRAEAGQYRQAIQLMEQAEKPVEKDISGWNHYVSATIAFLKLVMEKLKMHREELAAVPKPENFNPKDADGNPIEIDWPLNLNIVDKFISCFGQTYAEVYSGCTQEKQP